MSDKNIIEALLFASAEPLDVQAMQERLPEGANVKSLLQELQGDYAERGIHLVQVDNKWAFRTDPGLSDALSLEKQVTRKLSRAALETLSIIAYHQPITRAEIENIRGVATHKGTLDALMEVEWIKPGRRRDTPGRPLTWVTTNGFMDHFSLESMTDLPGLDDLKASGLLDRRPAIETLSDQEELFAGQSEEETIENEQEAV